MDTYITYLSEYWLLIVLAGASIVLAAFFAASETAIVFSNKTRLHKLAEAGNMRAKAALRIKTGRDSPRPTPCAVSRCCSLLLPARSAPRRTLLPVPHRRGAYHARPL